MGPIDFLMRVWKHNAKEGEYVFLSTKKGNTWKDISFKWGNGIKSELRDFLTRDLVKSSNIYFCPNPFTKPKRREEYGAGSACYWSDMDEINPETCDPKPSIAVESSPGRYVGIWKIKGRITKDQSLRENRQLTYSIGADRGGWDYGQVLRLPGTLNHKYKERPEVQILWDRDTICSRRVDLYSKHRGRIPVKIKRLLKAKKAVVGHRSDTLWYIEHELHKAGVPAADIIGLVKASAWNKYKGRNDEDERLENELGKILDNEVQDEVEEKQERRHNGHASMDGLVRMSEVAAESVSWVWYPYIPRGKVTLMEGDPSQGKSWLTFAIAAHLSRRRKLPNQRKGIRGRVLIMSAEDGLADTIRPRLDTLDADVSRVFGFARPLTLDEDGIQDLEDQLAELRPILVIIDPIVAYMGGQIDLHKANQTREFMAHLGDLASRYSCAILGIRHLTKGARDKSIYRGIGSIDLVASARSVLHIGQDPDNEEDRILVHIKCNLAPLGPGIRYTIRRDHPKPFRWLGLSKLTAIDLVQSDKQEAKGRTDIIRAETFLKQTLSKAPQNVEELVRKSEAQGISPRTLRRARERLGIEAQKENGKWMWLKWTPSQKQSQESSLTTMPSTKPSQGQ